MAKRSAAATGRSTASALGNVCVKAKASIPLSLSLSHDAAGEEIAARYIAAGDRIPMPL